MAENVFITMDSLTMMTEAVSSGAQVHLVCPEHQTLNPENSHHFYIEGLHKAGLLNLFRPGSETSNPASRTRMAMPDYSDAIRQILTRIGWER
jgi:mitochondrial fission protein ELM1